MSRPIANIALKHTTRTSVPVGTAFKGIHFSRVFVQDFTSRPASGVSGRFRQTSARSATLQASFSTCSFLYCSPPGWRIAALLARLVTLFLLCDGVVEGLPDPCIGREAQRAATSHRLAACPVDVRHAEHLRMRCHIS